MNFRKRNKTRLYLHENEANKEEEKILETIFHEKLL